MIEVRTWSAWLLLAAGCSADASAADRAAERAGDAPAVPPVVAEPELDPALARLPLGERLAREAEARPAHAIRPERVIAALRARGVQLSAPRQVLASTVGARYCEASRSEGGLAIAICEYADVAALARGLARSHAVFDPIVPGRTLIGRGQTLLTVTRPESQPAARELARAREVFAEVAPSARAALARQVD